MKAKTSKYKEISSDEFKKGAIYSLLNAIELHGDAMVMDACGRKPRVYSLCKLSLEETAKSLMFYEISLLKDMSKKEPIFDKRIDKILGEIENHNDKTKYALDFLISKSEFFIESHPNKKVKEEPSGLMEELKWLQILLSQKEQLDVKKNTNLYTSLINGEFKPPFISFEDADIENIKQLTYRLLVYVRNMILKIDDAFFDLIKFNKEEIKKIDLYLEIRNIQKLKVAYANQIDEIKRKYPNM